MGTRTCEIAGSNCELDTGLVILSNALFLAPCVKELLRISDK